MKKVLIIVDMQDYFLKNMDAKTKKEFIGNIIPIVKKCQDKNIPIIELEYAGVGKSRGKTISRLHSMYKSYSTIIKKSNGGFTRTKLDQDLRNLKAKEVILVGINANGCIQDTAIGALNRDYKVVTSLGAIGNTWSNDLNLSKNNLKWYQENTKLLNSTKELRDYISK